MSQKPNRGSVIAPQGVQKKLRDAITAEGEAAVVERLGIGRQTVARVLGGLGVRVSTLAHVRAQLGMGDDGDG